MKKNLCLLLAMLMLVAFAAACSPGDSGTPDTGSNDDHDHDHGSSDSGSDNAPPPGGDTPSVFLWDNFTDRDPNNKPDTSPNGAPIWWDNWANLRASVDNNIVQIQFRPGAFDPEDYDDEAEYYARAADWMGNWGEAIDMWSLDGISYCKYLTIRMSGANGGEQSSLLLHFQPEDGPSFVKRFSDLVTKDGGNVAITTDMQDIVIDLQASGFPGMTNRMHIRAFAECTVFLDEIYFSEAIAPIDTTSTDTIISGFTVEAIGNPADLPIKDYVTAIG
jgi:hypothetical protein